MGSLEGFTRIMTISRCADPRDKIYGLLGLLREGHSFPVDYGMSRYDLFFRAWEHFRCWELRRHVSRSLLQALQAERDLTSALANSSAVNADPVRLLDVRVQDMNYDDVLVCSNSAGSRRRLHDWPNLLVILHFGTDSVVYMTFGQSQICDSAGQIKSASVFESLTISYSGWSLDRRSGGAKTNVQLRQPQIDIGVFRENDKCSFCNNASPVDIMMSRQTLIQILCAADKEFLQI